MGKIQLTAFNKRKVKALRVKLSSPDYVKRAIDKIASELTHLFFKDNGY